MDNKQLITHAHKQSLLLNLARWNKHSPRPILAVKLHTPRRYPELEIFKQQMIAGSLDSTFLPYLSLKKKVSTYKAVFFFLGLVFLGLGACIFFKINHCPFSNLFGSYFYILKNVASGLCVMFSFFTFWLAAFLRTEKEALYLLLRRAKYKLSKTYAHKKFESGFKRIDTYEKSSQDLFFKLKYREAYDRLDEVCDATRHLLESINASPSLTACMREHLYIQALSELNDKLASIHCEFKSISLAGSYSHFDSTNPL